MNLLWRYEADSLDSEQRHRDRESHPCPDRPETGPFRSRKRDGKASPEEHPEGELIALDLATGKVIWKNSKEIYGTVAAISENHHSVMMSYQPTRFRLASEVGGKISVFDLSTGKHKWTRTARYDSRPVINRDTIYAQGGAWDIQSRGGSTLSTSKRSYGCGILAGSRNMMVFRSATLGYFDLTKNEETEDYGGIRPGCWINALPAGGLVLAPDGSAGCSCSYLNQSWIALQSDGVRPPRFEAASFSDPEQVTVRLVPRCRETRDPIYPGRNFSPKRNPPCIPRP